MPSMIFRGVVTGGDVKYDRPDLYRKAVKDLEGLRVETTVGKESTRRTLEQNKFYHGVVVKELCKHTGYSEREMHEELKRRFLPLGIESTTELTPREFSEFVERSICLAGVLDVVLPAPPVE